MKQKNIVKIFIALIVILVSGLCLATFNYLNIKDNVYRDTYYEKLTALKNNSDYKIITTHIKSMDRNIPNYTSSKLLVTNQKYDRVTLDNGQAYLIRNTDCRMTDNDKLLTIAVNKNDANQSFIFPAKQEISLRTAFYTGKTYQTYISDKPKIDNCSAISVD